MLEPGDHGSTFAGGPVAAAAALAALDVIDDPELLRGVRELGAGLREGLVALDGVARGPRPRPDARRRPRGRARRRRASAPLLGRGAGRQRPRAAATLRLLPPLMIEDPTRLTARFRLIGESLALLSYADDEREEASSLRSASDSDHVEGARGAAGRRSFDAAERAAASGDRRRRGAGAAAAIEEATGARPTGSSPSALRAIADELDAAGRRQPSGRGCATVEARAATRSPSRPSRRRAALEAAPAIGRGAPARDPDGGLRCSSRKEIEKRLRNGVRHRGHRPRSSTRSSAPEE